MTGSSSPTPIRKKQSPGVIIALAGLIGLALLGLIETVVLITLSVTGQIG